MSGIAGIISLDGAPVDREVLAKITNALAFRGPDDQRIQLMGSAGFGHTMLRTTIEAAREEQPCSLDGQTWITADCRVDAREELIGKLLAHGRERARAATDPELILHAWAVWGERCLDHLIGDFSFAIWDSVRRRLFCARDQMGVKLFYYAVVGNCIIFSNTLQAIRLHPAVSNRLDDETVGDYLALALYPDLSTTIFADIRRLPPASTLIWSGGWSGGEVQISQYWTLPVDPPLRLSHRNDYTELFLDLFRTVMRDRMRTDRVAVLMSGGLDSTAMAAMAVELAKSGPPVAVSAHTVVFDRLFQHEERHYATLAASHLGIPIHFEVADDWGILEGAGEEFPGPDPIHIADTGPHPRRREMGGVAREARVALFGEGPDNALHYEWKPYVRHELAQGRWAGLLGDALAYPFLFGEIPFARRLRPKSPAAPAGSFDFPRWLNPSFEARMGLRERFNGMQEGTLRGANARSIHTIRPSAYASFGDAAWQVVFESYDAGVTGVPVDVRHPFMDIRMARLLLAVPTVPWCRGKYLIRRALKGMLPREIIDRPKAGLPGFPVFERWKQNGLPAGLPVEGLSAYVDVDILRQSLYDSPNAVGTNIRAYKLGFFLRSLFGPCIMESASSNVLGGKA
jgi:asparagine synthase (glutamine-hydrolysing)